MWTNVVISSGSAKKRERPWESASKKKETDHAQRSGRHIPRAKRAAMQAQCGVRRKGKAHGVRKSHMTGATKHWESSETATSADATGSRCGASPASTASPARAGGARAGPTQSTGNRRKEGRRLLTTGVWPKRLIDATMKHIDSWRRGRAACPTPSYRFATRFRRVEVACLPAECCFAKQSRESSARWERRATFGASAGGDPRGLPPPEARLSGEVPARFRHGADRGRMADARGAARGSGR